MVDPVIAYPFIQVTIKPPPAPIAQRSPGVLALVGKAAQGDVNIPVEIDSVAQATEEFGEASELTKSLKIAMQQNPRPSKFYGVRAAEAGGVVNYAAALRTLEALDDVTFVVLANEKEVGTVAAGTALSALKAHIDTASSDGNKRIGVAMVDSALDDDDYVDVVKAKIAPLKSGNSRMIIIAARGATVDVAAAAAGAIAGYAPHISVVLKPVREVTMPRGSQYTPTEIKGLSREGVIPLIDPVLLPGDGLYFAEGRAFTSDANLPYIDLVRTLDDIEFRLKAGLIGTVGDARITKEGLVSLKARVEGILGPLKRRAVIDNYEVSIEVLNILNLPEANWTAADRAIVENARAIRTVDLGVTVWYGPAIHLLNVTLETKF
jgi:hypothetical protein